MHRVLLAAAAFAAVALTAGSAAADIVWTSAPSLMRRAPNPASRVVQEVPPSAQVDVRGCFDGWCRASWRHRAGYIPAYAVSGAPAPMAVAPPPPGVYAPPPIVYAPPPVVVVAPPPPPGPVWGGPFVGVGFGAW
jgi:hypothetical protein